MGDGARTVTVGVEEEFHLVDLRSRQLVPAASAVLEHLPGKGFTSELQSCVVETNSEPHTSLDHLRQDLAGTRGVLASAAGRLGLGIAASGSVPLARVDDIPPTSEARFLAIADDYRMAAREQLICGAQVHVGVEDRDLAVAVLPYLAPHLPVFLALSASSPYWLGRDTGYASWRTQVWQRWPTAGPTGSFGSAAEYEATVAGLVRSGVIRDNGMVYYDVRPSQHLPTLELRICDACPELDDVVALAALFRALVVRACEDVRHGIRPVVSRPEWLRAATWRAARSGLEGDLVDPGTMSPLPAADVVRGLLKALRPTLRAAGDWDTTAAAVEAILTRGSSAKLQRAAVRACGGRLPAAVDLVVERTRSVGGDARHVG